VHILDHILHVHSKIPASPIGKFVASLAES